MFTITNLIYIENIDQGCELPPELLSGGTESCVGKATLNSSLSSGFGHFVLRISHRYYAIFLNVFLSKLERF